MICVPPHVAYTTYTPPMWHYFLSQISIYNKKKQKQKNQFLSKSTSLSLLFFDQYAIHLRRFPTLSLSLFLSHTHTYTPLQSSSLSDIRSHHFTITPLLCSSVRAQMAVTSDSLNNNGFREEKGT